MQDWDSSNNTIEPELYLICTPDLLTYWRSKKNKAQLKRVTKLQEAALAEKADKQRHGARRVAPMDPGMESLAARAAAAVPAAATPPSTSARPHNTPCAAAYDRAHAALSRAACLVFDTETSGLDGSVLDIGWVLSDAKGVELASHEQLWKLPSGERIHSRAFAAHGIDANALRRGGVDPKPELQEFYALVAAALALGITVAAHNACFDVARLNQTARRHHVQACLAVHGIGPSHGLGHGHGMCMCMCMCLAQA